MKLDHDPCTVMPLPFAPSSAHRARSLMTEALAPDAPSHVLADASLVLTELVTNALKYGKPDAHDRLEVVWCLFEEHVRVCVCDAGTSSEFAPRRASPDAEGGRGLLIVDAISETWSVQVAEGSTRIVADIALVDAFTRARSATRGGPATS